MIPWEAEYQGKGPWKSWLVFQDGLLKPKNGPFQFILKWGSVAGGWPGHINKTIQELSQMQLAETSADEHRQCFEH